AMGMSAPPADRLAVAITESPDDPPALSYFAEVASYDPNLDLAVLRIVADVRGRQVGSLNLPALPIGDSDALQLGDRLSIFGYPGIGGETVTYTSGNVSGFRREEEVNSSRAWIKTDATIAGGNSGGTAINDSGELIGIPTQAAAGSGVTPVDARPVLDTNHDGRVDERDTPMAIGGFINGLRPVNLALALLAEAGMSVERSGGRAQARPLPTSPPPRRPAQRPTFSELLFSTRVTDDGRPVHPADHIPEGNDTVYATFEFENMRDGMPWSVVWMSNGKQIIEQQDDWHDGPHGRKAVKINNRKGLPAGEYHLVLGIEGSVALEGKVLVGNPIDETDSEISGTVIDGSSGRPIADAMVLVLRPDASLQRFLDAQDQSLVFTSAHTDANGSFTFAKQLPKGQAYSLVAAARGYAPLAVEGALRVSSRAPEKANVGSLELTPGF
ncbi:MAG: trypsin-like peptidase domain-containing protein, partial [Planctomycetales bacterium]|nr:trypsin-like peptidase domain-containing protein [Planctomycetales bacterium]